MFFFLLVKLFGKWNLKEAERLGDDLTGGRQLQRAWLAEVKCGFFKVE